MPLPPSDDVVNLEGHAQAQEDRQGDDIREIQLEADCGADLQGYERGENERKESEPDIGETAQKKPEQRG